MCVFFGGVAMPNWVYVVVIMLNIPVYYGVYRVLFRDSDEFWDAVFYWFKPDMWSFIDGEFMEDFWAELKLAVFTGICGACVYGELQLLAPIWMS